MNEKSKKLAQCVIELVCDYYDVPEFKIYQKDKTAMVSWTRQVIASLLYHNAGFNHEGIAKLLMRNRSTIGMMRQVVSDRRATEKSAEEQYVFLESKVNALVKE